MYGHVLHQFFVLSPLTDPADDPYLMNGAPVALQLVGPRLGDRQLLKDAELLDKVLNG